MGYGDGDEVTVVGYGPDENDKYITTYFRHMFTVNNAEDIQTLTFSLKRDDGAVVYLNGNEVIRSNMPSIAIFHDTYVTSKASETIENVERHPIRGVKSGANRCCPGKLHLLL